MGLHGINLIILAAFGLGGLYMMHLLAQDFIKIRQPIRMIAKALFLRAKRDINNPKILTINSLTTDIDNNNYYDNNEINLPAFQENPIIPEEIKWRNILSRDYFGCLQSLICQIMSGSEVDNSEAKMLRFFIEYNIAMNPQRLPIEIVSAYNYGLLYRNRTEFCLYKYPFCVYSAKTMLKILKIFTTLQK